MTVLLGSLPDPVVGKTVGTTGVFIYTEVFYIIMPGSCYNAGL